MWLNRLYRNHVLANLSYFLVLILGVLAYTQLPKEKAPDSLVSDASISISMPGASAEDVERLLVTPVERMLRSKIKDIKHVNSNAQSGMANVNVTFTELNKPLYERRMMELRRELQALAQSELPKTPAMPTLYEGSLYNSDWFKILVYGPGEDENFRRQARQIKLDLQRMPGVALVKTKGLEDPELHVVFHPERLVTALLKPGELRASAAESRAIAKEGQYLYGHQYGDLWFSLNPSSRDLATLLPLIKPLLNNLDGMVSAWVEGAGVNRVGKAINLNIKGSSGAELDAAITELRGIVAATPGVSQVRLDTMPGLAELKLRLDSAAIQRAGLAPETVAHTFNLCLRPD